MQLKLIFNIQINTGQKQTPDIIQNITPEDSLMFFLNFFKGLYKK